MSGSPEVNIARALFEGLVTLNPYTLDPEPGVAQSWTISDDEVNGLTAKGACQNQGNGRAVGRSGGSHLNELWRSEAPDERMGETCFRPVLDKGLEGLPS